jgi:uncharacterized protein YkwD
MFSTGLLKRSTRVFGIGALALVMPMAVAAQPVAAMNAQSLAPGDPALVNQIAAEQSLLDLTNADRLANGVDPLQLDPDAMGIARERAEAQLGTPALSHYDANGQLVFSRLLDEAQLPYQFAGENLARASADNAGVAQRVEQALMDSPLHRKNILEQGFKRVAIGAAIDSQGQISFAEVYRD